MWTIEDFLNGRCIINCRTKQEAKDLLKVLKKYKVKWRGGGSLNYTYFDNSKEATCYKFDRCANALAYAPYSYYRTKTHIPIVRYRELSNTKSMGFKYLMKILNGG